jgi:PrtD family type I secretion system ABC transporter
MKNPVRTGPFGPSSKGRFAERFAKIEADSSSDGAKGFVQPAVRDGHQASLAPTAVSSAAVRSDFAQFPVDAATTPRTARKSVSVPAGPGAGESESSSAGSPLPSAMAGNRSTTSPAKAAEGERADPIGEVRAFMRESLVAVIVFSVVINLLMLTGPLFMLQVYDRALPSGNVSTLVLLFLLVTVLYGFFALIEGVRARIFVRLGTRIDELLHKPVYQAMIALTSKDPIGAGPQPMRDLDTVRSYVSGTGPAAFFDIPWVPIYLGLIFFLHPLLGIFATIAAAILVAIALLNKQLTQKAHGDVARATFEAHRFAEEGRRDAPVVRALGMEPALVGEWGNRKARAIALLSQVNDRAGLFGSASKSLRLYFQSAMLALGAWLAIKQEISPGMIIAGTIIMSRGLAPIEQMIGQWRASVGVHSAWKRLGELFETTPPEMARKTALPVPTGAVEVVNLACFVPNSPKPVLSGVEFELKPGDGLGIIGPSGAGKSTLVKAVLGIWPQTSGAVRLDGAAHDQWDSAVLGRHIGYLPQEATLLPGTVAQNIARFDPNASSQAVLEAAKVTGAHELAVSLVSGYDTMVGPDGLQLSSGQAQRIALARAVYNFPPIVALDEPYSNLDADGEHALNETIRALRTRDSTVIVVTHRSSALNALDTVICIRGGKQALFGPKDEVLRAMTQAVEQHNDSEPVRTSRDPDLPARPHIVVSRPIDRPPKRPPTIQPQARPDQIKRPDASNSVEAKTTATEAKPAGGSEADGKRFNAAPTRATAPVVQNQAASIVESVRRQMAEVNGVQNNHDLNSSVEEGADRLALLCRLRDELKQYKEERKAEREGRDG